MGKINGKDKKRRKRRSTIILVSLFLILCILATPWGNAGMFVVEAMEPPSDMELQIDLGGTLNEEEIPLVEAGVWGNYYNCLKIDGKYECCILEYIGPGGDVTVPTTFGNYKVVGIYENAFKDCNDITSITLPRYITSIGDGVFSGCSSLESINLPSGLKKIGDQAFYNCRSLQSISIPDSCTEIGAAAFQYCSSLSQVTLPYSRLTQIKERTFQGCRQLKSIYLPNSLSEIGTGAFELTGLETVTIRSSMTYIRYAAFRSTKMSSCWIYSDSVVLAESSIGEGVTIYGLRNSTAQEYAEQNGCPFIPLGEDLQPEPTPTPVPEPTPAPVPVPEPTPVPVPTPVPEPTPAPTPGNDIQSLESFVSRMYTIALDRNPDSVGKEDWVRRLLNHETDGAGIAHGFIMSQEFQNHHVSNEKFVDILYRTFFDRAADAEGRSTWLAELAAGRDRGYVLAGFVNSAEFDKLCDTFGISRGIMREDGSPCNPGIRQFVERCYTKVLKRDGEKDGINDWVNRINSGIMSAEDVAKNFFFSKEYVNKNTGNAEYVETLYETFLGRSSDPDGKKDWVSRLNAGMDRNAVLEGFSKSAEFSEILKSYGL